MLQVLYKYIPQHYMQHIAMFQQDKNRLSLYIYPVETSIENNIYSLVSTLVRRLNWKQTYHNGKFAITR